MNETKEIKYLNLDEIIPNRMQPRTIFDEEKLNELAESIKQYGIINPILVRKTGDKYELIAGERRCKAASIAGLKQVPAKIEDVDDNKSAELAIIENIQRQELTPLEEARAYRKILDIGSINQEQLASKMGKNQSTIANKMRLLNLCSEVQDALDNNQISERHARTLLQVKNINTQREVLEKIIKEKMNVKATETYIKDLISSNKEELEIKNNNPIKKESNIIEENMYKNDIVNINDLNKEELEEESDNMNNDNNMTIQPNIPVQGNTMAQPNIQGNNVNSPAFGERFFPSLEDEPTNLNLNSPFGSLEQTTQQPMMENLTGNENINPAIDPLSSVPNIEASPIINPMAQQQATPQFSVPDFSNTASPINMEPPVMDAPVATPEPMMPPVMDAPVAAPEPMMPPVMDAPVAAPEPMMPPVMDAPVAAPEPMMPPVMDAPVAAPEPMMPPVMDAPVAVPEPMMPPVMDAPVIEPEPMMPEEPLVQEPIAPTTNIINAINALKNLALSIESIGYKINISEEDNATTYKIIVELDK